MALGALAALAALIDGLVHRRLRRARSWGIAAGAVAALALGLLDNLVHSRDAWTSVVPEGVALSAATVLVMLVTAWLGAARPSRGLQPTPVMS